MNIKKLVFIVFVFSLLSSFAFSAIADDANKEEKVVSSESEVIDEESEAQEESIDDIDAITDINDYEEKLFIKYSDKEVKRRDIEEDIDVVNVNEDKATESETGYRENKNEIDKENVDSEFFGAGNHVSNASPSVVIHSTYDRYEIYSGENAGNVSIFDDNGNYYNGSTNVKVIRDMIDGNGNSPILLKLSSNVKFFGFDKSNDNYVLLPAGFVESMVTRYSGNGYLNPQGISALDHIEVSLSFNNTNIGKYDLFEYGVLYYLSCYEGVLGEYYYYDPSTTDIDKAFYYFNEDGIGETKGALLTSGITKDGCTVDSYGRWVIGGVPQIFSMP